MKVLFANRADALRHMGGDTVQMMSLRRRLSELGLEVAIHLGPDVRVGDAAVVHFFNISRIHDTFVQMKRIVQVDRVRRVVSPIYWNFEEFNRTLC